MFEFIAFLYAVKKLDYNHIIGILKSGLWLVLNPVTIIKKRINFRKIRKVNDKKIMENMTKDSIVLQHYLLRKKTYSDIVSKKD